MHTRSLTLGLCGLTMVTMLAGCASPGEVRYATGRRAGVSPDGLHIIDTWGGRGQRVYVKPGVDLRPYDKVILEPVVVRFGLTSARTLDDDKVALVKKTFREIFQKELEKSEVHTLVTESGPDVLRVTPQLADLVITAPATPRTPDEQVIISSVGAVTLALELSDSRTHAVLVRAYDRRAIGGQTGGAYRESPGANLSEARLMFSRWAQRLRSWLDSVHEIPLLPADTHAEGT